MSAPHTPDDLRALIAEALPYVEDAATDPAFKALRVGELVKRMRKAVEAAE